MPFLFWLPLIIESGMLSVANENTQALKTLSE